MSNVNKEVEKESNEVEEMYPLHKQQQLHFVCNAASLRVVLNLSKY